MESISGIAGDQIKNFIERIERLEEEKKAVAEDIKEVYAQAKAVGFDPKIMRQVIKVRKMDARERADQETLLDIYLHAIESGATAGQATGMAAEATTGQTDLEAAIHRSEAAGQGENPAESRTTNQEQAA